MGFSDLSYTRDDSYINKSGSGWVWLQECKSTGQNLDTPDTDFTALGRVSKSIYKKETAVTKESDEGGEEVNASSKVTATMDITIMQRDKKTIDLPEDLSGRYARIIKETSKELLGPSGSQVMQYLVVAVAELTPTTELDGSDMYQKQNWTCKALSGADVTVTLTGLVGTQGVLDTASAIIATGEYHQVVEATLV